MATAASSNTGMSNAANANNSYIHTALLITLGRGFRSKKSTAKTKAPPLAFSIHRQVRQNRTKRGVLKSGSATIDLMKHITKETLRLPTDQRLFNQGIIYRRGGKYITTIN